MESGPDAHRHFEQLAVAHVLGGLTEPDARVFRSHLLECPTCRARVGELRAIAHDLADVERDERLTKAAKAVETKKRELDVETDPGPAPGSTRTVKVALSLGLVLLIVLTGWNFLLRQNLERRMLEVEQLRMAATLLQLGLAAEIEALAEEVEAEVRYDAERIVIAAEGLVAGRRYAIYLTDARGNLLDRPRAVILDDSRLLELVPRVPGTATLTVTQPEPDVPPPASPDVGRPILQASLPAQARSSQGSSAMATVGG